MDYLNEESIAKPLLTEPGVKSYLNYALKQCHIIKINYYNTIYNITLFIIFIVILGGILYYKYKGKPTEEEKQQKNREKQQYILEKIKNFQEAKKEAHQRLSQETLITGLPHFENPLTM
jgi:uncharacterized protein YpmB